MLEALSLSLFLIHSLVKGTSVLFLKLESHTAKGQELHTHTHQHVTTLPCPYIHPVNLPCEHELSLIAFMQCNSVNEALVTTSVSDIKTNPETPLWSSGKFPAKDPEVRVRFPARTRFSEK
jgi:hypothetical protein